MTTPQTHLPKMMYLRALETIDTCRPSQFFIWLGDDDEPQQEGWGVTEGDSWAVCIRDDENEFRLVTAQELRTVLLKALAYDELMKIGMDP